MSSSYLRNRLASSLCCMMPLEATHFVQVKNNDAEWFVRKDPDGQSSYWIVACPEYGEGHVMSSLYVSEDDVVMTRDEYLHIRNNRIEARVREAIREYQQLVEVAGRRLNNSIEAMFSKGMFHG